MQQHTNDHDAAADGNGDGDGDVGGGGGRIDRRGSDDDDATIARKSRAVKLGSILETRISRAAAH